MPDTNPNIDKTNEVIKIIVFSAKNNNKISGIIHIIGDNLIIGKGPFLSEINPKIGPITIKVADWSSIKNCNEVPSIPISAPKVRPVPKMKENENDTKSWEKASLQNLKVLINPFQFLIYYINIL